MSPEHPHRAGTLVLVVGPSGAGKDTILRQTRNRLGPGSRILFPRRVVTRPPDASEDNEAATPEDFAEAAVGGAFLLAWEAHGLRYGVRRSVLDAMAQGGVVVVNASRAVVPEARRAVPGTRIVLVTAPPEVLAARLAARGRDGDVASRLARDGLPLDDLRPDLVIDNAGPIGASVDLLLGFVDDLAATRG